MFIRRMLALSLTLSICITLLFFLGKIFYMGGTLSYSLFDVRDLTGNYSFCIKLPYIYPALLIPAGLLFIFIACILYCYNVPGTFPVNLTGSLCFLSYPFTLLTLPAYYPFAPAGIENYFRYCPAGVILLIIIFILVLLDAGLCIFCPEKEIRRTNCPNG